MTPATAITTLRDKVVSLKIETIVYMILFLIAIIAAIVTDKVISANRLTAVENQTNEIEIQFGDFRKETIAEQKEYRNELFEVKTSLVRIETALEIEK